LGFFLAAIPWYAGAFLLFFVALDHREKPGLIACTVVVSIPFVKINNEKCIIIFYLVLYAAELENCLCSLVVLCMIQMIPINLKKYSIVFCAYSSYN